MSNKVNRGSLSEYSNGVDEVVKQIRHYLVVSDNEAVSKRESMLSIEITNDWVEVNRNADPAVYTVNLVTKVEIAYSVAETDSLCSVFFNLTLFTSGEEFNHGVVAYSTLEPYSDNTFFTRPLWLSEDGSMLEDLIALYIAQAIEDAILSM